MVGESNSVVQKLRISTFDSFNLTLNIVFPMAYHLRITRPVSDLGKTETMYCAGLALSVIGSFENHDGFDGVMLGQAESNYHFEFTKCSGHFIAPCPTTEDLVVFYIEEASEWQKACDSMLAAGFKLVVSFNPYWDRCGRTFEDHDGYRIVIQNAKWITPPPSPSSPLPPGQNHPL